MPLHNDRGSSPRMRGAPDRAGHAQDGHGIIPADAGSTRTLKSVSTPLWDHPRGCGEHIFSVGSQASTTGSSPRMRGALSLDLSFSAGVWIIPADAGSTLYH